MQAMKDALADQLAAVLEASHDQHLYALIDGALQPDAWALLSRRFKVASLLPEATDGGKSAVAALPFLVGMEAEHSTQVIRHTVGLAFEHYASTWLRSPMNLSALAQHLAHRLQGRVPDMDVMLRFADARVLPALRSVLDPEQAQSFFAGVTGWWYLDRDMQLTELGVPDNAWNAIASEPWAGPLALTADQEGGLMALSDPDVVIALIQQHDAQALAKIPKPSHHRFVKEKLLAARDWDITSPADQALFCMIALDQSPEFLASDAWQQVLQQVKSRRISLMQALEQMTP